MKTQKQVSRRGQPKRSVNRKLLIGTVIGVVFITAIAAVARSYQLKRNEQAYLTAADAAEADQNWVSAVQELNRYLTLQPEDRDARIRLAKLHDRAQTTVGGKNRSVELYDRAIGLDPDNIDLRRRRAELLLDIGRDKDAEAEADWILAHHANDASAQRVRATSLWRQYSADKRRSPGAVIEACTVALAHPDNKGSAELALISATLHRQQGRDVRVADQIIDTLVKNSESSAEALLARYRYRSFYKLPNAETDLAAALALSPDNPDVLLEAGAADARKQDWKSAASHFDRVIQVAPQNQQGYLLLSEVCMRQSAFARAVDVLKAGTEKTSHPSLRQQLTRTLIHTGNLSEARESLKALQAFMDNKKVSTNSTAKLDLENEIHLLAGEISQAEKSFGDALVAYEQVRLPPLRAQSATAKGQFSRLWLNRGASYAALGQWDLAAAAYEQAAELESTGASALMAAGAAWEQAGRIDLASQFYSRASIESNPEPALIALAKAEFRSQLVLPETQRDWSEYQRAFKEAKATLPKETSLDLLQANFLAQTGQVQQALDTILALSKSAPNSEAIKAALVLSYELAGQSKSADSELAAFEQQAPNSASVFLLKCELLLRRRQYSQARMVLLDGIKKVSDSHQAVLSIRLAELNRQVGNLSEAREQLAGLVKEYPRNVQLLWQLALLAVEIEDMPYLSELEQHLQVAEGSGGSFWRYCRGIRLCYEAKDADDERYAEAVNIQIDLRRLRPAWPNTYLLLAKLAEKRGDLSRESEAYQSAVDLGTRNMAVLQRLIALLYEQGRVADAEKQLTMLGDLAMISPGLSSLAISDSVKNGEIDEAIRQARESVKLRPHDAVAHLTLGQTLLIAGESGQAEKAFVDGTVHARQDARSWLGLIAFYSRAKQPEKASEALAELKQIIKLPAAQQAFILAQAHQFCGEVRAADEQFRLAIAAAAGSKPEVELRIQQAAAAFFTNSDLDQAEKCLRRVLELSPQSGAYRRQLALNLAARGGDDRWDEAWQLVATEGNDSPTPGDRRMQALLLMKQGGNEALAKSQRLLESLIQDPEQSVASDRLLLAQVYEVAKEIGKADEQFIVLTTGQKPDADHLASYAIFLIRNERFDEANSKIAQLRTLYGNSLQVLQLTAAVLKKQERLEALVPLADEFLEEQDRKEQTPNQNGQITLAVAELLNAAGQSEAAEKAYRRLVTMLPQGYAPLIGWLVAQNRVEEAVDLCAQSTLQDQTSRPVITLASALVEGNQYERVLPSAEKLIDEALRQHTEDAALMFAVATLRQMQNRTEDAAALYERLLEFEPNHVMAMNNLAVLLSEQASSAEKALEVIDRAIASAGQQPLFIDTRGMILLRLNRLDEALKTFENVVSYPNPQAGYFYHLALAQQQSGKLEDARLTLATAKSMGLDRQLLTANERASLRDLEGAVGR